MSKEVDAFVANVLDSYRVTLTVGEDDGVAIDDRVTVWRIVEVTDPSNGEHLGRVRIDNVKLVVQDVYPKFSVAVVPHQNQPIFANFPFMLPRKRISSGVAGDDERTVVREGDEATIYINDGSA